MIQRILRDVRTLDITSEDVYSSPDLLSLSGENLYGELDNDQNLYTIPIIDKEGRYFPDLHHPGKILGIEVEI